MKYLAMIIVEKTQKQGTEWAPDKLTIGAARLLVRWTVRMSPLLLSSFEEEIAI